MYGKVWEGAIPLQPGPNEAKAYVVQPGGVQQVDNCAADSAVPLRLPKLARPVTGTWR